MIAHLIIPIFSSPTNPIGTSDGRISLTSIPTVGRALDWVNIIIGAPPDLISALNTSRAEYIDKSPQIKSVDLVVGLDGVHLHSEKAARTFAHELQEKLGLVYVDY